MKSLVVVGIGATLLGGLGVAVYSATALRNDIVASAAEDMNSVSRLMKRRREAGEDALLYIEAGDLDGYQARMEEEKEASRADWERMKRKHGIVEEGDAAPVEPAPVKRVKGAYYPDDVQEEPPSASSIPIAAGLAGAGGLLVFGTVGIGAFRLLGGSDEEEPATDDAEGLETDPDTPANPNTPS